MVSLGWIYDLFILATQNKLEDVDGLPLNTTSTTHFPLIHVRIVGNHTTYCEHDHVNSVAPGTSSGWGQEPRRTKRNCNAIIRNSRKNHFNYWTQWKTMPCLLLDVLGRFCSRCESLWTLFKLNAQLNMFKHALVKTTKAHAGWIKLARHTVT